MRRFNCSPWSSSLSSTVGTKGLVLVDSVTARRHGLCDLRTVLRCTCCEPAETYAGPPTGPGRGPFWHGPAWRTTAARPRPGPARLRRAGLASWPGPARQRRAATAWAAKTTCTKFMPLSNLKKSGIIFANWLNESNHCKVIIFIFWTTNKLRVVGQSRRSLSLVLFLRHICFVLRANPRFKALTHARSDLS